MAIFSRTIVSAQPTDRYWHFREQVRKDFHECCAYCLLWEFVAGGRENFELDHFRPKSLPEFSVLENDFQNLYYSCHPCNHQKGDSWPVRSLAARGYRFFDPCEELFSQHFESHSDGRWIPHSRAGEYTEKRLRLNRQHPVEMRRLLNEIATARSIKSVDWDVPSREAIRAILQTTE